MIKEKRSLHVFNFFFFAISDTNIFLVLLAKKCGIQTQTYPKIVSIWTYGHLPRLAWDMTAFTKMESIQTEIITIQQMTIMNMMLKVCQCSYGSTVVDICEFFLLLLKCQKFVSKFSGVIKLWKYWCLFIWCH